MASYQQTDSPAEDDAPLRRTGRRKRGETRAMLIEATIELVRKEGLHSLTTERLTTQVGISQPGFYRHFKSIDDCLRVAVSQIVDTAAAGLGVLLEDVVSNMSELGDLGDFDRYRQAYRGALKMMLAEPRFAELFLRYRRDPSILGGHLRALDNRVREQLVELVVQKADGLGIGNTYRPMISCFSEGLMALTFGATEAVLDGRHTIEECAEALAINTRSTLEGMLAMARDFEPGVENA